MLRYPVSLTTEGGQVLVDFLDLPAHTYGDGEGEALARAVDALTTMIGAYMRHRQPIPAPSAPNRTGGQPCRCRRCWSRRSSFTTRC